MSELTDDELTVLMIAARGESLMAIGRWEKPVKDLNAKALLLSIDSVNYVITDAGRTAAAQGESDADDMLARGIIGKHNQIVEMRNASRHSIEQAALHLSLAATASAKITGDTPQQAAEQWSREVLRLAIGKLSDG